MQGHSPPKGEHLVLYYCAKCTRQTMHIVVGKFFDCNACRLKQHTIIRKELCHVALARSA